MNRQRSSCHPSLKPCRCPIHETLRQEATRQIQLGRKLSTTLLVPISAQLISWVLQECLLTNSRISNWSSSLLSGRVASNQGQIRVSPSSSNKCSRDQSQLESMEVSCTMEAHQMARSCKDSSCKDKTSISNRDRWAVRQCHSPRHRHSANNSKSTRSMAPQDNHSQPLVSSHNS